MEDYIVVAILAVIVGLIVFYIYRSKKKGNKCIGCPYSSSCQKHGGCSACDKSDTPR